jgi:hypothetical protein
MTPETMRMKLIALKDFIEKLIDSIGSDADELDVVMCLMEISEESVKLASSIANKYLGTEDAHWMMDGDGNIKRLTNEKGWL